LLPVYPQDLWNLLYDLMIGQKVRERISRLLLVEASAYAALLISYKRFTLDNLMIFVDYTMSKKGKAI
jgi:hypothetical protein